MSNRVDPRRLTPGAYYKATYDGNVWYVHAQDNENVRVLWKNGRKLRHPDSGRFSAAHMTEVPATLGLSGGRVQTNRDAVTFLDNEY